MLTPGEIERAIYIAGRVHEILSSGRSAFVDIVQQCTKV